VGNNVFGDPALQINDFRIEAVVSHQALTEDVGVEQQAAAFGLVVREAGGDEQFACAFKTPGIDFLNNGSDLRLPARPVAYGEFDSDAFAVTVSAVEIEDVKQLLSLVSGAALLCLSMSRSRPSFQVCNTASKRSCRSLKCQ
jgi:hypothetical protein